MDIDAVRRSYARWARIYDQTFGALTSGARRRTIRHVNTRQGRVLEVGVGTGLALPLYAPHLEVSGLDYSEDMLAQARARKERLGLDHVRELRQMDARELDFPDASFDTVVAMHVISVVPEPERVMAEMVRVLRPGGQIVMSNHFARDRGFLAALERIAAPLENLLGWHSDFPKETVLDTPGLTLLHEQTLPPVGMMTLLVLEKERQEEGG